jgi:hypothetical protein
MKISDIKKKYKNEWVLLKVDKTDELNQPIAGKLIAHSKNRDDVYSKMKKTKGHTYTLYTGPFPREGYAVAF